MADQYDVQVQKTVEATGTFLWKVYHGSLNPNQEYVGKLVFPKNAKGKTRIGEQEARQTVISNLRGTPFCFSVETPTKYKYSFSGKGKRCALTDLTLYRCGRRLFNIEFKAGNTSTKRLNKAHIHKDLEKLISEDETGYWFHILEKANGNAMKKLWETISDGLKAVTSRCHNFKAKSITFHFCVLREGYSIETTLHLDGVSHQEKNWLEGLHPPHIIANKGMLIELTSTEAWKCRRFLDRPLNASFRNGEGQGEAMSS